jgi:hypothetical protein
VQATAPHPDDPFAGYGPQPVRCRWLSSEDEERSGSARVIRLVVAETRWSLHWPNVTYQRNILRDVAAFVGHTRAVVVTPAGMITGVTPWLEGDAASVAAGLRAAGETLGRVDLGPLPELLLGLDACVPNEATPFQSVVHLAGASRRATAANTTLKLYPNDGESAWLVGWLLASAQGGVPAELAAARRVQTAAGLFLVLVCHDACLFSARSRARLEDVTGLAVREHFDQAATAQPRPDFVLLATHHQGTVRSGGIFKNVAALLAEETGAAVTTTFAPATALEEIAWRFPTRGRRADEVVTVLVEDT